MASTRTENLIPYDMFGDRGAREFPAGTYTARATVYSAAGRTGIVAATASVRFTVAAEDTPVGPPRELSVVSGPAQVNVGWRKPDTSRSIDRYEVRWAPAGGSFGAWYARYLPSGERELYRFRAYGLTDGTSYRFEVRAALGGGEYSETAAVSATPRALPAPGALRATAGHARVDLAWAHAGTRRVVDRYEIRWAPAGGSYGAWARYERTGSSFPLEYAVEGLTNGVSYRFEVRAHIRRVDNNGVTLVEGYSPAARADATPAADSAVSANISFCLLTASSVQTPADGCDDPRRLAYLVSGTVVDAPESSQLLNIRADVTGVDVGSVFLELRGPTFGSRTENLIPYDLFGDRGGETFRPGSYTLKATVYAGSGRGGGVVASSTVGFTIRAYERRVFINSTHAYEGVEDVARLKVVLTPASSDQTVSVDWATEDRTAIAGSDYVAASGTFIFAPGDYQKRFTVTILDDDVDEGNEEFRVVLSNATNARIESGGGLVEIRNTDAVPAALLARFGRAVAGSVVDQVDRRVEAAGRPPAAGGVDTRAAAALRQVFGAAGVAGALSPPGALPRGASRPVLGLPAGGFGRGGASALEASTFVHDAGFAVPDLDFGGPAAAGGRFAFWTHSAGSGFAGRDGALALDGDVRTTLVGADYSRDRLTVGFSVGRHRALGRYAGHGSGRVDSALTGVYPWLGYRLSDRFTAWTAAGYGAGSLEVHRSDGLPLAASMSLAMAAAGTRGRLTSLNPAGGVELAFKADALWVHTGSGAGAGPGGRLAATAAAVSRLRGALEGSRAWTAAGRLTLRPSFEVGLRADGGDAETGAGVDVGAGLVLADARTGLAVDVRVRRLLVHEATGFADSGLSVSVAYDPQPATPLGFRAHVAPGWGQPAAGGAEALWNQLPAGSLPPCRRRSARPYARRPPRCRSRLRAAARRRLRWDAEGRSQRVFGRPGVHRGVRRSDSFPVPGFPRPLRVRCHGRPSLCAVAQSRGRVPRAPCPSPPVVGRVSRAPLPWRSPPPACLRAFPPLGFGLPAFGLLARLRVSMSTIRIRGASPRLRAPKNLSTGLRLLSGASLRPGFRSGIRSVSSSASPAVTCGSPAGAPRSLAMGGCAVVATSRA